MIQADPATNSLIIAAPDPVYNTLRGVIEQLDSRRAQVHMEALIAEVSATKAAEFGIQYQNFSGVEGSGTNVVGGTNFNTAPGANIIGRSANILSAGPGLNIGVINGTINIPGVGEILDLRILARALETNADANILSTPNLLTMDNEEAKIVVGKNVPFITGSFAQPATSTGVPGATVNPFQTIERRDVGLTLRIKPQVSEGGSVKLKIFRKFQACSLQLKPRISLPTSGRSNRQCSCKTDKSSCWVVSSRTTSRTISTRFLSSVIYPVWGCYFVTRRARERKPI